LAACKQCRPTAGRPEHIGPGIRPYYKCLQGLARPYKAMQGHAIRALL